MVEVEEREGEERKRRKERRGHRYRGARGGSGKEIPENQVSFGTFNSLWQKLG